ncbi:aminotransferase class I/II-fold pyridoxal phosphate-dependent enzyme [Nitratireductor aquimarinus]|uniref:aminotransferase class I/II-fold pyridoxal phosphate-dependent enzyme n=1 Tax=Alphaproteobacteria TaxID=28211 RepID=UPI0019D4017A|nr:MULTISPECIES: aminotransferase class I/II-fold pyridoxal phosphate-dependent enzyme [Alphaproteobacteria]MBN7758362.1 aminotransferase class I/II-fold pyridoxal phosphate-dependent enzyme [Nitratireductor aquimarinus]MBY6001124.1 aminotransferase class I/II-fold pyridoxal phosphate-dependent enzyme [Tritonibacter mobilis]MBY6023155.1 aminotransferase class I/II-fold pyridoxal phosphate-dependent enzyme [Nitratireductor sp. DP7N14-4]MDV2966752.1 aminotransferase class I/II-fold pyridoxal phos
MRDFALEVHFSRWEFNARHHMTASDMESMTLGELTQMAGPAAREQLDSLWLGYTETWGAPDLREAIAATYDGLSASNILCFAGAEEGIYAAMRVMLTPDDHAIVSVPNYQAAETVPLGLCAVTGVPLLEDKNWRLDLDAVRAAIRPNTKLISVNLPNNPTGALMPQDDFAELVEICRAHDLYLFSDEVYRLLERDESKRLPQAAEIYEKGISLNVMSKAYGLPGLRIGWIASPDTALLLKFERYKHYLSICNSAPSERLAVMALSVSDRILERNRALIAENLEKMDAFFADHADLFDWTRPDGGCVAYPRYRGADGVEAFCRDLVEEQGVLLLPASVYHSELMDAPAGRFRIGFGRRGIDAGLTAMRAFLERRHNGVAAG